MTASLPPHPQSEILAAERKVLLAIARYADFSPAEVRNAIKDLDRLAAENVAWGEQRRQAYLAIPMHYVRDVGDRLTICGLDTRDGPPYGWVGPDREFIMRRIERGGTVCLECAYERTSPLTRPVPD